MFDSIVLATTNDGKITEMKSHLQKEFPEMAIFSLKDFTPAIPDIEETGITYYENAMLKINAVSKIVNTDSTFIIAEDSGLEVSALGNRPGVFSHRYADDWELLPNENFNQRNIRKMIHELHQEGMKVSPAAYHCEMIVKAGIYHYSLHRTWHGYITDVISGTNGFGYDPIFYDSKLLKSAAFISEEEKYAISHRGQALEDCIGVIKNLLTTK